MHRAHVNLTVNGKHHQITCKDVFLPISDFLRYELGLTGSKIVCAEGDCGACTVLYKRLGFDFEKFQSLNTCVMAGLLLDGCQIVTVEGLGTEEQPSEVQSAMLRNFGDHGVANAGTRYTEDDE